MQTQLYNRVSKDAFARLEPYGSKDPRTVLRGLSAGNRAWLPDFISQKNIPNHRQALSFLRSNLAENLWEILMQCAGH
jgi:hypothetical protein